MMIIIMKHDATEEQVNHVTEKLKKLGFGIHFSKGVERVVIGAIGDKRLLASANIELLPGVAELVPISKPYKLVSREFRAEDTVVKISDKFSIGDGKPFAVIAGPCSVESKEQIMEIANTVKEAGADALRGGAYKPRTSPYSFQGLGEEGLKFLAEARKKTGLPIVTECLDPRDIQVILKFADVMQIGARNMQNFSLLKEVGKTKKPIMLKRGPGSTIQELLMSAEYILSEGNRNVILCERGIKTLETYTRNTLDLSAIPVIKELSHLPVIIDPSHGTGRWKYVPSMSLAAVAAGADGIMVEVHPHPDEAMSDGPQSLTPENFMNLMKDIKKVAAAIGRKM
jgi:3-deoxy-7-phosphoheptulonate synthase